MELRYESGRILLVLEDPGGQLLDRMIGIPFEIGRFLRLAIHMAAALGEVHQRGLIHKDIKPAHFLVDAADHVRLTGFGLASRLPRERQAPAPPEVVAGTLAYMAPEQTGRMNRSIDARSDLYALGVTFYEMLTGKLPFTAADPMEWVHCHIARQPVPIGERAAVPGPIAAIVMKLLAKTAEERYQTAAGLTADLRQCLTAWDSQGSIAPFPLGAHDVSGRLLIPEKLYGREREISTLLAAFDRVVANSTVELVFVSGYSGIGKSSVVNELHKVLVPPRGLFASGKFDQYKRDIPYTTLAQAFQSLVRLLLVKSEAELGRWREALSAALGPNGQLMVNLIPELELVIGKQQPVADLPPQDAQNRFQLVFRRFLGVFAQAEHPLALFLDDLQWLDTATLDLLEHLATHAEVRHLLLVGAYRDNEVGPAHPLTRTLEAIRQAGARVQEIVLAPLRLDDIGRLVADALHCAPERAQPLAQLVHEKTGGNPFFAIQFFTALAEEGLLAFDPVARVWQWDMDRIRAKSYADNVVDLMVGKLKRLSAPTQDALKQLACLGNVAEIATLTLVHGATETAMHTALWEAVQAELIIQLEGAYEFLHDRIQQAAYSLIPEARRAEVHLRIGRVLLASLTANELAEHLFEVANQFSRGAALLIDRTEKAQVAALDLQAGRKAKASAAHASASVYFSAGMALLDESDWHNQYELTFSLWLERAECEFLTGHFDETDRLIAELLRRGRSKVDQANVYQLKVRLHVVKSENPQAVDSALTCLRLFGIDIPAHPSWEQVTAEYETVWPNLAKRPIEELIDLPLMTDPDLLAAMRLLSDLDSPAYFTDFNLFCMRLCRMMSVGLQHGTSGAFAHGCAAFGMFLGPVFHRYRDGYRFAKLACDVIEKHGFIAHHAKVHVQMGEAAFWVEPITVALAFNRMAFRSATETGDLTFACYSIYETVAYLLARNDPLDAVWRETEIGLDFVRKAGFHDVADIVVSQQRFVAAMRGQTASLSTFSGGQFDAAAFEAQLTGERMPMMACFYWILKLEAKFLAGDYESALAAARLAEPLIWTAIMEIQLLDYVYYAALTIAALHGSAAAGESNTWREQLTAHHEKLREWAGNCASTFASKYALVSAEIARLEGRNAKAIRLYEEAIQSAREYGLVQNEGVAHELAAGFYQARGATTSVRAHLEAARSCFARWGAEAKVRQLEQLHPYLRERPMPASPTATFRTPVAQLDVGTVVKATQAVSGEIVLSKLIETLMRIAIEHAGAERGLLILFHADEPRVEAEARTGSGMVEVTLRQAQVTTSELPESILHYVIRTRESVILDDAVAPTLFATDAYVQQRRPRSVLCLPLVKQTKLVGVLYLENNLTPRAFTSDRIAVLELLALQAAISLENADLYSDLQQENIERKRAEEELQRSEAFLAEGQRISHTGSWGWNISTGNLVWSEEHCRIFGFDPAEAAPTFQLFQNRLHPEDRAMVQRTLDQAIRERSGFSLEFRILLPDGSIKYLHGVGRPILNGSGDLDDYIGTTMDITERKRSEEALRNAQADLTRVARLTTVGELAASIAHEINQPIGAMVASGNACLRWLAKDPPQLDEARRAAERIVRDGHRAGDVIKSVRALAGTSAPVSAELDINAAIREVLSLMRGELNQHDVALETDLSDGLAPVLGDRVQLEQVVLNLILNAIDAMSADTSEPRVLRVRSQSGEPGTVLIAVEDTGPGLPPEAMDRLFEAFFTTKPSGMGMGLSICRSIVNAHGGRLWASQRSPHGAVFQFTVPTAARTVS
ncbi:MAG TPA: AAA family ATPase [Bryobacteraceae bacterium]|nr:AAA family ATPase [Bryobacteraceae bacterium]